MNLIKSFLTTIDTFGVPYLFKYKSKENYKTPYGGIVMLLFLILTLVFGIYSFIPYLNKKNFNIVYYTMFLPHAESINLRQSKSAFSIGLECEDYIEIHAQDIFTVEAKFVNLTHRPGFYFKNETIINTHPCTKNDFYNEHDESFDYLSLEDYQCLDNNDFTIEGIYTDEIFSYYEFTVKAKYDTNETLDNIFKFLNKNQCKFQVFYTDITIDIDNYKEPIKSFLNSLFIQLDPTLFIKRDVFFMNQYLVDNDYVLIDFNTDRDPKIRTLFSRYDQYSIYIGANRTEDRNYNAIYYAKIYFRSDTRKTNIKRKYQKFMEFYADTSGLLIGIYTILEVIFNYINYFYAQLSLAKKIFIFKEVEDNQFDYSQKYNEIKKLISLTKQYSNINNQNCTNNNINDSNNTIINDKIISGKKIIFNRGENKKERKINFKNNKRKLNLNLYNQKYEQKLSENMRMKETLSNNENNQNNIKEQNSKNNQKIEIMDLEDEVKINDIKEKKENIDLKYEKKIEKLKYNFNFLEILISSFFKCCMPKNLSKKKNLNDKASEILYKKLDIVLYVRNTLLLDIIHKSMLEGYKKNIINFLCRPIISINEKLEDELQNFYKVFTNENFDDSSKSILTLVQQPIKQTIEQNLLSLCYKQLSIAE